MVTCEWYIVDTKLSTMQILYGHKCLCMLSLYTDEMGTYLKKPKSLRDSVNLLYCIKRQELPRLMLPGENGGTKRSA